MIIDSNNYVRDLLRQPLGSLTGEDAQSAQSAKSPQSVQSPEKNSVQSIQAPEKNSAPMEKNSVANNIDQLSISGQARALLEARRAKEFAALNQAAQAGEAVQNGEGNGSHAAGNGSISSGKDKSAGDPAQQVLGALKKQVEAARKQLEMANQALQQAISAARSDPELESENDSVDVKAAQGAVLEAKGKLLHLQEQMNKAMRAAFGITGTVGPAGTSAEGGFGGSGPHIGEAQDPYAAAQAAEAAELAGTTVTE
ncbi:MAG: hypothetical protein LBV80_07725 [Deltaproteobacteria bacterium]|jgi:hypothetical protein|nr:hypothetical protein [Deltaproteobacteria bacterium]